MVIFSLFYIFLDVGNCVLMLVMLTSDFRGLFVLLHSFKPVITILNVVRSLFKSTTHSS